MLAALSLLATSGSPALAALSYAPGVTDNGLHYLIVNGEFESTDDLSKFVTSAQISSTQAVTFNSSGGSVAKAMELGRLIRSLHLITMQARGLECASACSLAFMGGTLRFAQPGAIGVHKSSFSDDTTLNVADAVSAVQQMTANVIAYMTEMGVDPAVLQLALTYNSDDIRYLSGSEMEKYHLTMTEAQPREAPPAQTATMPLPSIAPLALPPAGQAASQQPSTQASLPPIAAEPLPSLAIPVAKSGRVQNYKGQAPLKAASSSASPTVATFMNGSPLTILDDTGKWFRVRIGNKVGYMFRSWVWVAEFGAGPYGSQFVQVKSFDNYPQTEQYVRSSPLPLTAFLASNGWFAITLDRTFDPDSAEALLTKLKASGSIPDDAIVTWGNAFVRKVCCTKQ
ncbi:SH3 domain-containing protein [Rhizobium miluonense]|uniref:SH3b domain-containing protein n=1 Tax=Rhizobium miluonense TaxID=411945 RepID=A0ABU1SZ33_9HYPH|nr:SH3 domain-containing protein [Rhizobium miluonense]MDR6904207.1 hypothetical protein [Rhizobium miluonense]